MIFILVYPHDDSYEDQKSQNMQCDFIKFILTFYYFTWFHFADAKHLLINKFWSKTFFFFTNIPIQMVCCVMCVVFGSDTDGWLPKGEIFITHSPGLGIEMWHENICLSHIVFYLEDLFFLFQNFPINFFNLFRT